MKKKFTEEPLIDFYRAIAEDDEEFLKSVHIPHSSVFYVKAAYEAETGQEVTLREVEIAMLLEGMLATSWSALSPSHCAHHPSHSPTLTMTLHPRQQQRE